MNTSPSNSTANAPESLFRWQWQLGRLLADTGKLDEAIAYYVRRKYGVIIGPATAAALAEWVQRTAAARARRGEAVELMGRARFSWFISSKPCRWRSLRVKFHRGSLRVSPALVPRLP